MAKEIAGKGFKGELNKIICIIITTRFSDSRVVNITTTTTMILVLLRRMLRLMISSTIKKECYSSD